MNATQLSAALADRAEEFCRQFLPGGSRQGNYWIVGDIDGNAGRSMYVRLVPNGGPAGKWKDAANDAHGDLLDILRHQAAGNDFGRAARAARAFLGAPPRPLVRAEVLDQVWQRRRERGEAASAPHDPAVAARRLWKRCRPLPGTAAARYLEARGIPTPQWSSLRFHPELFCFDGGQRRRLPGLVAAVTDDAGQFCAVHRTWLDPARPVKADLLNPRKALGPVLRHAVRFGHPAGGIPLVVGEGIETVLSVTSALPGAAGAAALSAAGVKNFRVPADCRLLIVAADRDRAGVDAARELLNRHAGNCEARMIVPEGGDWNDDLASAGLDALRDRLAPVLAEARAALAGPERLARRGGAVRGDHCRSGGISV